MFKETTSVTNNVSLSRLTKIVNYGYDNPK